MIQPWKPQILCLLALAASSMAHAGDTIATDRPDFVESSDVVGKGHVQIETSLAMEREAKNAPKTRTYSTPTLLRIGVSENVEVRMESDGFMKMSTWEAGQKTTEQGTSDISFGLKWHVKTPADNDSGPSMAWLFHFDAPTGTRQFRGQGIRPSARLVAEWDFGSWSAGVMPGVYIDHNDDNKRYVGGIFAAVIGTSLTERLRAFVEFAGQQLTTKKNGGNVTTLDAGLAYLITDTVQVDIAFAKGLSSATPKQQWTTGLSMLF